MATWTYGGVRVFVTDIEGQSKQIVARLFPYQSATVHQVFGWEDKTRVFGGKVVGGANVQLLESFTQSGVSFELANPGNAGVLGNFILSSIDYTRDKFIKQTIDTTQDPYTPVYTVKMSLLYDV